MHIMVSLSVRVLFYSQCHMQCSCSIPHTYKSYSIILKRFIFVRLYVDAELFALIQNNISVVGCRRSGFSYKEVFVSYFYKNQCCFNMCIVCREV
jgi:hypothetical protein